MRAPVWRKAQAPGTKASRKICEAGQAFGNYIQCLSVASAFAPDAQTG